MRGGGERGPAWRLPRPQLPSKPGWFSAADIGQSPPPDLRRQPDDCAFPNEVFMREDVPQAGDLTPWNVRMPLLDAVIQALRRRVLCQRPAGGGVLDIRAREEPCLGEIARSWNSGSCCLRKR